MSKLKIGMAGLLSAAFGFVFQGCFAAQPLPECTVITTAPALGINPYLAKLTSTGTSGDCTDVSSSGLPAIQIATQRFATPGDTTFKIYLRPDYPLAVTGGDVYGCDDDLTNDCSNTKAPGKCTLCVTGSGAAAKLPDGGSAVDPTPSADGGLQGIIVNADAGTRVSLTNKCGVTVEGVARSDSTDPDAKNINVVTTTPQFPKDGICALTAVSGGVQKLDAYECADGTKFPAIDLKTEFSKIEVVNSAKAPSTYFTADLKLTEGSCVSSYSVVAFWPVIDCTLLDDNGDPKKDANGKTLGTDVACDPNADIDAGRVFGSGISPNFKPKCDADLLVCVPTATKADLVK